MGWSARRAAAPPLWCRGKRGKPARVRERRRGLVSAAGALRRPRRTAALPQRAACFGAGVNADSLRASLHPSDADAAPNALAAASSGAASSAVGRHVGQRSGRKLEGRLCLHLATSAGGGGRRRERRGGAPGGLTGARGGARGKEVEGTGDPTVFVMSIESNAERRHSIKV